MDFSLAPVRSSSAWTAPEMAIEEVVGVIHARLDTADAFLASRKLLNDKTADLNDQAIAICKTCSHMQKSAKAIGTAVNNAQILRHHKLSEALQGAGGDHLNVQASINAVHTSFKDLAEGKLEAEDGDEDKWNSRLGSLEAEMGPTHLKIKTLIHEQQMIVAQLEISPANTPADLQGMAFVANLQTRKAGPQLA